MTNSNIRKFRRANAYLIVHTASLAQMLCFPTSTCQRKHIMVWLYICVLRWVTRKTLNQLLNGIHTHLHKNNSKGRYSAIIERTSNRKALRIMNYSALPLLFRSCLSCATRVLKVLSTILEDVNFPAMPLSLKQCLIVATCVGLSG